MWMKWNDFHLIISFYFGFEMMILAKAIMLSKWFSTFFYSNSITLKWTGGQKSNVNSPSLSYHNDDNGQSIHQQHFGQNSVKWPLCHFIQSVSQMSLTYDDNNGDDKMDDGHHHHQWYRCEIDFCCFFFLEIQ